MCSDCGWFDVSQQITDMIEGGGYEWAEDTLGGIQDWIEENEHVTERQEIAIENIGIRGD